MNGVFDNQESWGHISFSMLSCSLFLFWLFPPWLEKLYNFFSPSHFSSWWGWKTWGGPRQTVNGLDFQWSSRSADRCLTWEWDWRSCQLGPGANLPFEEIRRNLHRWWWIRCRGPQTAHFLCFFTPHFSSSPLLQFPSGSFSFAYAPYMNHLCAFDLLNFFLYHYFSFRQEHIQEISSMAQTTWLDMNLVLVRFLLSSHGVISF